MAGEEDGLSFWGIHHNLGAEPLIFWQKKILSFLQLDEQKMAHGMGVHRVGAGLLDKTTTIDSALTFILVRLGSF